MLNLVLVSTPVGIYLLKVNDGKTRTMWNLFKVNNKDISFGVSIVDYNQVNHGWVGLGRFVLKTGESSNWHQNNM